MIAIFSLLLLLLLVVPMPVLAQDNHCRGPQFQQLYQDTAGRDVRLTCVIDYGSGGDILLGGMAGGDIVLSRLGPEGELRWRRSFATGSESTELTLLNGLLIDPEGMIAGIGSHFQGDRQVAVLFRYNPVTKQLLYYRTAPCESDPTGIALGPEGEYVVSGSRIGAPSPIFRRAYFQRFRRSDGSLLEEGRLFDMAGEETIFDVNPLPGGGYLAAGTVSVRGSAGAGRSNLMQLDARGRLVRNLVGPVDDDRNARLFAFDVEQQGGQTYVLQWGDLDRITGATGTSPVITAFGPDGQAQWTRRYDLTESTGEVGIEMEIHAGGLLIYGYTLVGRREIFLMQLEYSGDIRWARRYSLPGNAQVYQRANQQLLVRSDRILVTATFSFRSGRSHEGLLLQLDREGLPLADCLDHSVAAAAASPLSATWGDRALVDTVATLEWPMASTLPEIPQLVAFDDCDQPCADCTERKFRSLAVCAGDSVLTAFGWRGAPDQYTDTLSATAGGCDTLVTTELVGLNPLMAESLQLPNCGLPGGTVIVTPSGGLPPYTFSWSDGDRTGGRATLDPGQYSVTVADASACGTFILPVTVAPAEDSNLRLVGTAPSCAGESDGKIELLPAGTGWIKLLSDSLFSPDALSGLSSGTHSIIVRLEGGCEVYREATVPATEPLTVRLQGPARSRLGDSVTFVAESSGATPPLAFQWTADATANCLGCNDFTTVSRSTGYVTVTLTDGRGCRARDSLLLIVERDEPRIYLPTAFSPNGDGHHDRWDPGLGPEVAEILVWRVFSRWGALVWAYREKDGGYWDGGSAGAGVYLYTLTARLIDGTTTTLRGEVTVVR